jgi:hypothetical protein
MYRQLTRAIPIGQWSTIPSRAGPLVVTMAGSSHATRPSRAAGVR